MDYLQQLFNVFLDIGRFVGEQIDILTTALYNTIATVFGLEETDSVYGSIKGFLTIYMIQQLLLLSDTYQTVKGSYIWFVYLEHLIRQWKVLLGYQI